MDDLNAKTVIVTGIARGGTSTVAGILHILGVDMGPNRSPSEANPRGSYEDALFQDLDAEIIRAAGGDYWLEPLSEDRILEQRGVFEERIQDILVTRSKGNPIWGWKNPMSVITIDLYLPHIVNPYFVVVTREVDSVANSMVRFTAHLQKLNYERAYRLASYYRERIQKILKAHPDIPTVIVDYETILEDPVSETRKIANLIDLKCSNEELGMIRKFVIPPERFGFEKRLGLLKSIPVRSKHWFAKCIKEPLKTPVFLSLAIKIFFSRLFNPENR